MILEQDIYACQSIFVRAFLSLPEVILKKKKSAGNRVLEKYRGI